MSPAPDFVQVDTLLERAREQRLCDLPLGLRLAGEALALLEQTEGEGPEYWRRYAEVCAELGSFHKDRGDYREGLRYARRSLRLCRERALREGIVANLVTIGWCHLRAANHPEALRSFLKALKIARELGLETKETRILGSLNAVYFFLKEYEKAAAGSRQVLERYRAAGSGLGTAAALNNLSYALMEAGQLEEARDDVEEALALVRTRDEPSQMLGNLLDTRGEIAFRTGAHDEALDTFYEALRGFHAAGDRQGEQTTRRNVGKCLYALGRSEEAVQSLEASLRLAEELGATTDVAECHRQLWSVWKARKRPSRALHHYEAYHDIERRTHEDRIESRLGILQVEHDLETARHQADIHRLENVELARAVDELERTKGALEERMEELRGLYQRVSELSVRDGLTGAHNRRYLDEILGAAVERARRSGRPLALGLADLDDFKRVNDRYSHRIGDEVLRRVARILASEIRACDCVARYGGEEFVLVMADTSVKECRAAFERVRRQIESHDWSDLHPELSITLSAGVAEMTKEVDGDALLHTVDALLYEAKRMGKNRVVAADHPIRPYHVA